MLLVNKLFLNMKGNFSQNHLFLIYDMTKKEKNSLTQHFLMDMQHCEAQC